MPEPLVALDGIHKRFGSVRALSGVSLDLAGGEVHALLGENGAGKTTLMNVLYGLEQHDEGTISIDGSPVRLRSPQDAVAHGIGMVHQHFKLVPTLTVAENMVLGERGHVLLKRSDLRAVDARLRELGERYGLEVDPRKRVWQLSVGQQQRVEILRALYHDARILILDEPTACLTPLESERLFPKLRGLAAEGAAIVFITHHLDDVIRFADRITVMRLGEVAGMPDKDTTTPAELARLMVGRDVTLMSVAAGDRELASEELADDETPAQAAPAADAPPPAVAGEPVLRLAGISSGRTDGALALDDVSLEVAAGEIVAIAGVEGNGQAELEELLLGLHAPAAGQISLDGRPLRANTSDRLAAGLGVVPSDRYRHGVIGPMSVAENLVYDRIDRQPFGTRMSVRDRAIATNADEVVPRYSIKVDTPRQAVGTLSGGNAQRVVLARTLTRDLRCLVAAQPTRGLDVGAIEFMWEQLAQARERGLAILLISTELDEVMAMADRCAVLYRGRIVDEMDRDELDRERLGLAMGGGVPAASRSDEGQA